MRTAILVAALLGSLLVVGAGCGPGGREDDSGDGTGDGDGMGDGTGDGDGMTVDGAIDDGCSDQAKLVYTIDENYTLATFDPATKQFTDIGSLENNCPSGSATPFSMGIDRNARAYVLYSDGKVYTVDTTTLACSATTWSTQLGLELFGMGFSTETAGGTVDSLFVAGGSAQIDPEADSTLARIDVNTMQATRAGTLNGSPELTGNSNGELWGFFPGNNPRVAQIDKSTGMLVPSRTFTPTMLSGTPTAWAFAFHGGDYHVFLAKGANPDTTVYQIDGTTGAVDSFTPTNRTIVGAGVSTCAPIIVGKQ